MKVLTSRRVTWRVYRSGLSGVAWWSVVWAPAVLFVSGVELWQKALITAGIVGVLPLFSLMMFTLHAKTFIPKEFPAAFAAADDDEKARIILREPKASDAV